MQGCSCAILGGLRSPRLADSGRKERPGVTDGRSGSRDRGQVWFRPSHRAPDPSCCGRFMTTFDSTKTGLGTLLDEIIAGKIQLPDFQRGWVWDDEHIKSLLVSIARSFPIGAVMLLETGGEARFQVRPVEGVSLASNKHAERLILDGQQRLTSLLQVLKLSTPVSTRDDKKREIKRHYYFDIEKALAGSDSLDESVIAV